MEREKPGFCILLSLGNWLMILGAIAGAGLTVAGFMELEGNRGLAIQYIFLGTVCLLQSLVAMGVIQAIQWMVNQMLTAMPEQPEQPATKTEVEKIEDEDPDGIRHKPVLKRRKFSS